MREIEESELSGIRHETSPSGEFDKHFIVEGIGGMAKMVSRYGVNPESVDNVRIPAGLRLTDEAIAEKLSGIEIYDQELNKIDFTPDNNGVVKDNELIKAAVVTYAKAQSLIEATSDKKTRTRLEKFRDDILDKTGQVISGVFGKKGMRLVTLGVTLALLTACSPNGIMPIVPIVVDEGGNGRPTPTVSAPLPTETKQRPTVTAVVPKFTPTTAATSTPEATNTPETRQFKECVPAEFLNCRIDLNKDLLSGDYGRWFASKYHVDFDQSLIKNHLLHEYAMVNGSKGFGAPGNLIMYDVTTAPNYKNTNTEPFARGLTAAVVTVTDNQGHTYDEAIIPVIYNNPEDPKNNIYVLTALSFWVGRSLSPQEEIDIMNIYMTKMNIPPLATSYYDSMATMPGSPATHIDPILKKVFDTHDMASIFQKVTGANSKKMSDQSLSPLNDPTIIVGTDVKLDFKWYK